MTKFCNPANYIIRHLPHSFIRTRSAEVVPVCGQTEKEGILADSGDESVAIHPPACYSEKHYI